MLTVATEDSTKILKLLAGRDLKLMHFQLERYEPVENKADIKETFRRLSEFDNIIYGGIRNAKYFMVQVESFNKKEAVRKRLNLTLDEETAAFLENAGVPAVCTYAGGKSINLVEFMLRMRRMGPALYPCGSHKKEEIPGFLEELDIPVKELELFHLKGPKDGELKSYRKELEASNPDVIVFHSRRSVNRTLAAFPDLNYVDIRIISADRAITKKLEEKNIIVAEEAEGSWESIAGLL